VEIDNEFRNYIRPLSNEEFEKLEASILSEGIRDPLVVWQGILLDGYHRYKIAQEHGLEYKTVEVELPDRDAAKEWILVNQLGRRNLTEQEASYYRGKLYSAKKQQGKRTDLTLAHFGLKLNTAEELGKQYGVSKNTIKRDEEFSQAVDKVADEVGAEARNAILSGQAKVPKESVEQLIEIKQVAPEFIEPILSGELPISKAMREIQRNKNESKPKPELPKGKYRVIYADPPWSYDNSGFNQSAASHYPTMSTDDICTLDVENLAVDDTVLFLWTTSPLLPDALRVIEAWGFEYKASMVWVKDKAPGIGWWLNTKHELLLIACKDANHPKVKLDSVIYSPVTEHSKKPVEFYEAIEKMYPNLKKVELFARNKRSGWDSWGNEV